MGCQGNCDLVTEKVENFRFTFQLEVQLTVKGSKPFVLSLVTKTIFLPLLIMDTCKIRFLGYNHMFVAFSALLAKFKIVNKIFLYALERREHTNYHRLFGSRSEWKACAFKKGMYNIIQILK